MPKGSPVLALAAGFGGGFLSGQEDKTRREERAEDRRMRRDSHEAQMEEVNHRKQERIGLADAATPATVEEVAAPQPEVQGAAGGFVENAGPPAPSLAAFRVRGTNFNSRAEADAAAAAYNSEAATDKRVSLALAKSGNVLGAKQYSASARQGRAADAELADKEWSRQLRDSMGRGHDGIAEMVTRSQGDGLAQHKFKPIVSPDGKQVTYGKVAEDGTVTPVPNLTFSNDQDGVVKAAYMLDRTVTPEQRYSHAAAEARARAAEAKAREASEFKLKEFKLKERELEEVKIPTAESRAALAEVRMEVAKLRGSGAGGDKVSREERLRYTSLFSEAGRRMSEAQKAIGTLQKDVVFMSKAKKPGTQEAEELASMKSNLQALSGERELYQGLLAGSAGKKGLADSDPAPAAKTTTAAKPGAQPAQPKSQAEYDALPKGARYIRNGQPYVKN